jgi:hypothetical protein
MLFAIAMKKNEIEECEQKLEFVFFHDYDTLEIFFFEFSLFNISSRPTTL